MDVNLVLTATINLVKVAVVLLAFLYLRLLIRIATDPDPELTDHRRWLQAALATGLAAAAIWALLFLSGCKGKPQPPADVVIVPPTVDSTRLKLDRQARSSAGRLPAAQQTTQSTQTHYEHAKRTFDSISVTLP